MATESRTPGQVAYEAYAQYSAGRSLISGDKLPSWEHQNSDIRAAWEWAAEAVRAHVHRDAEDPSS